MSWTAADVLADVEARIPRETRWFAPPLLRALGVRQAFPLLERTEGTDGSTFVRAALSVLRADYEVCPPAKASVVPDGPLLVVANHHLGGLDALALLDFLLGVRSDVLVIANRFLRLLPPMRPLMIAAYPISSGAANHEARTQANLHLAGGGCLLTFPAARVASLTSGFRVADPPWRYGTGDLIRAARPTVLPIGVCASNSWWFYALRTLNFRLGTAMLLRELLRARGARIRLAVGDPIPAVVLAERSAADIVAELRGVTYGLVATGSR